MIPNREVFSGSLVDILDNPHKGNGVIKQWSTKPEKRSSWSYPEITHASQRLASFLTDRDIQPHDRILIWGANSPEWLISYFGTLRTGVVVVPFDYNREANFLDTVIEAANPRLIIADEVRRERMPTNIAVPIYPMEEVSRIPEAGTQPSGDSPRKQDLAEVVFTSGTTGNSKGVMLTHGNIISNVEALHKVVDIKPHLRMLSILPLSHMFETTVGLFAPMASGASIIYLEGVNPHNLTAAMVDEKVTSMVVVPRALQLFKKTIEQAAKKHGKDGMLNGMMKFSPYLPESVRRLMFREVHKSFGGKFEFFVSGGARLDPEIADFYENLGIKILQGYGATETSPIITCDSIKERDHQFVGRPMPGVSVRIAEDDEVWVKGPNVMQGYWNNQEATDDVLQDGWYHTRDLGVFDKGRLRLRGRKGDMMVLSSGLNVYPEEVEEVLMRQGVKDAVVFARQMGSTEGLHAVLLSGGETDDFQSLIKEANRNLAAQLRINEWSVWGEEDFPRTHTLKVKRGEVIEKILKNSSHVTDD